MKICKTCKIEKDESEFGIIKNKINPDKPYLHKDCKECFRKNKREEYLNPEIKKRMKESQKKYSQKESSKIEARKRVRKYQQTEKGKSKAQEYENLPKTKEHRSNYKKTKNGKLSAANYAHNRRQKINKNSYRLTENDWKEILLKYNNSCAYCKKEDVKLEIDHIIPLSRGGLHEFLNLAPACGKCNRSKGNKLLSEWNNKNIK